MLPTWSKVYLKCSCWIFISCFRFFSIIFWCSNNLEMQFKKILINRICIVMLATDKGDWKRYRRDFQYSWRISFQYFCRVIICISLKSEENKHWFAHAEKHTFTRQKNQCVSATLIGDGHVGNGGITSVTLTSRR